MKRLVRIGCMFMAIGAVLLIVKLAVIDLPLVLHLLFQLLSAFTLVLAWDWWWENTEISLTATIKTRSLTVEDER